jgi:hypothetical protein
MALLRRGSPYIAGYAIPQNVIDEPFRRGAIVSKYRKRKTIDVQGLRNPRNPGGWPPYILPQSVRDEPLGQGVRTTHYTKRGTIFGLIPEIVTAREHTERVGVGIFDENKSAGKYGTLSNPTLAGRSSLGALADAPGGGRDGVAQLAKQIAGMLMADARQFRTPIERKIFLQAVLGNIDSSFPAAVESKAELLMKAKKYDAKTALLKAITVVVANHTLDQLMEMGKTGKAPTSGLMGLGACCAGADGLGGLWSSVKSYAKKGAGVILAPATGGASLALTFPGTASKVADKAKNALDKVGKVACKIANSGLLKLGAMAGGAAAGGPQGAQAGSTGADVAQGLCAPTPGDAGSTGGGFPIIPVAIGGGAILLAVILLK